MLRRPRLNTSTAAARPENYLRTQMPSADRDEVWSVRATLVARLRPEKSERGRKAAGGQKAGRGRPIAGPVSGPAIRRPSDEPEARAQQDGVRRKSHAAPEVWDLYRQGNLKQSQMDAIVTLPPERRSGGAVGAHDRRRPPARFLSPARLSGSVTTPRDY